jgi:indolepyruvate decarboxylase
MTTTTVIDYIVQRIADEGVQHCFGVPGDYAFPIGDAVDRSPNIRWVGCSNELNASYAADGYARVRGAAMLSTTYAVGELSAINGVMGAKAERSLVFHVVGMPSYQNQRLRKTMHHTLGDGIFDKFIDISAQAACAHAVINPDMTPTRIPSRPSRERLSACFARRKQRARAPSPGRKVGRRDSRRRRPPRHVRRIVPW